MQAIFSDFKTKKNIKSFALKRMQFSAFPEILQCLEWKKSFKAYVSKSHFTAFANKMNLHALQKKVFLQPIYFVCNDCNIITVIADKIYLHAISRKRKYFHNIFRQKLFFLFLAPFQRKQHILQNVEAKNYFPGSFIQRSGNSQEKHFTAKMCCPYLHKNSSFQEKMHF